MSSINNLNVESIKVDDLSKINQNMYEMVNFVIKYTIRNLKNLQNSNITLIENEQNNNSKSSSNENNNNNNGNNNDNSNDNTNNNINFNELIKNEINNNKKSITIDNLIIKIFNDTIKRYQIYSKKRNRRIIPKNMMCMGRKLDCLQCTRKRLPGKEYCLSHSKKLTMGRIDEVIKQPKIKAKRGRKKKYNYDERQNNPEYATLWEDIIKNKKYLIDINNNVFTFDLKSPKYLGKKTLEGGINYITV